MKVYILKNNNLQVISIGKIHDIYNGFGITKIIKSGNNQEGLNKLTDIMDKSFTGLCMVNLADFDSRYGHTRDLEGYAHSIEELDVDIEYKDGGHEIVQNAINIEDLKRCL